MGDLSPHPFNGTETELSGKGKGKIAQTCMCNLHWAPRTDIEFWTLRSEESYVLLCETLRWEWKIPRDGHSTVAEKKGQDTGQFAILVKVISDKSLESPSRIDVTTYWTLTNDQELLLALPRTDRDISSSPIDGWQMSCVLTTPVKAEDPSMPMRLHVAPCLELFIQVNPDSLIDVFFKPGNFYFVGVPEWSVIRTIRHNISTMCRETNRKCIDRRMPPSLAGISAPFSDNGSPSKIDVAYYWTLYECAGVRFSHRPELTGPSRERWDVVFSPITEITEYSDQPILLQSV
ncbi:hypothetical protein BU17DRAFT_88070 [Hysterangium stoloniferum]|nr:hypothetical protein BU17DRAFT_88070 [Hysterangium stoloniferum]